MNINDVNTANSVAQNTSVQATKESVVLKTNPPEPALANPTSAEDGFTRSRAAERLSELSDQGQALREELTAITQADNMNETDTQRNVDILRELNGIEREAERITQPEPDSATRLRREAINNYNEQNQNIQRASTTTNKVMDLVSE